MLLHDIPRRRAERGAQRVALVFDHRKITYGELYDRSRRCAALLVGCGIKAGDRVALYMRNQPELLEIVFAAASLGAISVPLNYRLSGAECDRLLADCDAKVCFADTDLARDLTCPTEVLTVGGAIGYESRLASCSPIDVPGCTADMPVLLQYTSGTTGLPKGVLSRHQGWTQSCMIEPYQKGLSAEAVYLNVLPMCHTGGLKCTMQTLFAGGTAVIAAKFDADQTGQLIARYGVTHTTLAPTMLRRLLKHDAEPLRSLQYLDYGSERMPADLLREAVTRIGCKFTQGYGMTEIAGGSATFMGPECARLGKDGSLPASFGSVGRPLMDCDIRIISSDGSGLDASNDGEIAIRSERTLMGYWKVDEPPLDADGFYHTGDLGRFDDDGFLYIIGRQKDMIISGGLNIYSREVELILEEHPGVDQAHVIGLPDQEWGERMHAVVVADGSVAPLSYELTAWCRDRIAHYKVPAGFTARSSEDVPRTSLGKVQKWVLKEQLLKAEAAR